MVQKTNYIDSNNNSPQIVQLIVDEKNKLSFSYMLFVFRIFIDVKKSLSSCEDEITNEVKKIIS